MKIQHCNAKFYNLKERDLSIIVHSLFSGWMLAFLFEGRIFYALMELHSLPPDLLSFSAMIGILAGLLCGFFVKTKKMAKKLFLLSYPVFIFCSLLFLFSPSKLWSAAFLLSSFLAGGCVASWGFYFKSSAKKKRFKTAADLLILSNVFMTILNLLANIWTPQLALLFSIVFLLLAFLLAFKLPDEESRAHETSEVVAVGQGSNLNKLLLFLSLFILLLSVNSGLMYQVMIPAFAHLERSVGWLWALPYVVSLLVMRNLPTRTDKTYLLYFGMAMMGLSFIGFMALQKNFLSYYIVNGLMLWACGIYDLFWWSILGEMMDFSKNPATILGVGLAANVLGIFLGGLFSFSLISAKMNSTEATTLLALTVVCLTLALLPLLNKYLVHHLRGQPNLAKPVLKQDDLPSLPQNHFQDLTEREMQVATHLLKGMSYQMIANELMISENTVKYHVKHIYSKLGVKRRDQLIELVHKGR